MEKTLQERARITSEAVGVYVFSSNIKDRNRIKNILEKPKEKQVRAAEVMASRITGVEKALCRAFACAEYFTEENKEEVTAMTTAFLKRVVELNISSISPTDIVYLGKIGAIK